MKLKAKTKTVIQIDLHGDGGLIEFISECYNLSHLFWGLDDETYQLFTIDKSAINANASDYITDSSNIIMFNQRVDCWLGVGIMLFRLCRDGFIPPGNYLVFIPPANS